MEKKLITTSDSITIDGKELKVTFSYVKERVTILKEWEYVPNTLEIDDIQVYHNEDWYSVKWLMKYYNMIDIIKDNILNDGL